jgi:hypothetical protein
MPDLVPKGLIEELQFGQDFSYLLDFLFEISEKSNFRLFPNFFKNLTKPQFFLQIRIENSKYSRKINLQTIWEKKSKIFHQKPKNPSIDKLKEKNIFKKIGKFPPG